jgi:hypothetical protein
MELLTTIKFDKFSYTEDDIIIPKNYVFYRGVSKDIQVENILRDVPLYVASKDIAKHYGEKVLAIKVTKPLKLMDFRKLKNQIRMLLATRPLNINDAVYNSIYYLTLSFGLCSYWGQITLLELFLQKNGNDMPKSALDDVMDRIQAMKMAPVRDTLHPLEPEGVRVGETFIDAHTMLILSEIYNDKYDGFISPKMYSPFHVGGMSHEEIVIFNPKKVGLEVLPVASGLNIKKYKLDDVLNISHKQFVLSYKNVLSLKVFQNGGDGGMLSDKNDFFEKPCYEKAFKKACEEAKEFGRFFRISKGRKIKAQVNLGIKGEPVIPRLDYN